MFADRLTYRFLSMRHNTFAVPIALFLCTLPYPLAARSMHP